MEFFYLFYGYFFIVLQLLSLFFLLDSSVDVLCFSFFLLFFLILIWIRVKVPVVWNSFTYWYLKFRFVASLSEVIGIICSFRLWIPSLMEIRIRTYASEFFLGWKLNVCFFPHLCVLIAQLLLAFRDNLIS